MDDLISRQQAIDALRNYLVEKRCPDDGTLTCRLIENEVINMLPSVQPEVIHCGECKQWKKNYLCDDPDTGVCGLLNVYVPSVGYCYWAERKVTE